MRAVVAAILLAFVATAAGKSYEGYKTFRVIPHNVVELNILRQLAEDESTFDFWSQPRVADRAVDVMVSPSGQSYFQTVLNTNSMEFTLLIDNVETVITKERQQQKSVTRQLGKISFNQYYRYDDIQAYLKQLAQDYPNLASYSTIGTTYEGRNIGLLKISSGGSGKRALFFEAGIHAREWIAPAVALYIINQLVENYSANKALVDNADWYIVPVTNPDGYEYTHTNDRFWRKNRNQVSALCKGTDANRNFGFQWGGEGASTNPCAETYRGASAFSEKESQAIRDAGTAAKAQTDLYIALHSYGPYFLYPWGYQWDLPADWRDLDDLANKAASAIKAVAGTTYDVGSSTQLLYAAAGGSDDWFKGGNGVKYAYTVELPGGGSQGFDPPASRITPIVTETWAGIKVVGSFIGTKK